MALRFGEKLHSHIDLLSLSHLKYHGLDRDAAMGARDRDPDIKHLRFLFYQYKPEVACPVLWVVALVVLFIVGGICLISQLGRRGTLSSSSARERWFLRD